MLENLIAIVVFLLVFISIVCLVGLPIFIAYNRQLDRTNKILIVILSLFGFTWFIALILSLLLEKDNNLDKLEKLANLYKNKVITKAEYETLKDKYKID